MTNNLTFSTGTYDTSGQKFGTAAINAGYGSTPAIAVSALPFTIEAWVKLPSNPGAVKVAMGSLTSTGVSPYFGCSASGLAQAAYNVSPAVPLASTVSLFDGSWHHLALVLTSSGATFFVDGAIASTSSTVPVGAPTGMGVGNYYGQPNFAWPGEVDEAAVWSIAKYTAAFTPPTSAYVGNETGLANLWHLDSNGTDSAGSPSAATAYTLGGPSTGTVSAASSNFTVLSNGVLASAVTITPSDSSGGGTFTPTTVTLAAGTNTSATFTYTAASAGAKTISTTNSGSLTNPSPLTYTASASGGVTVAPNNAAFIYTPGNWDVTSARALAVNAGAGFRIMTSSASITLNFDVSNDAAPLPQVYYRIDGYSAQSPWTRANVAASIAITMPSDIVASYHLLEFCIKSTSYNQNRWNSPPVSAVAFTGLTLANGSAVLAPTPLGKSILVFGDSITEGCSAVNHSAANDPDQHDAMMGYAHRLGALLGAEVGVVGFSAQGWVVAGQGNVPAFPTSLSSIFSGKSRTFGTPDLIVINQGTNDSGQTDAAVTSAVTTALNSFLTSCPTTRIAVMRPFNGSKASAIQAGIAACSNPSMVNYIDTTGFFNTAYGVDTQGLHPTGANALGIIAPQVAAQLTPLLYGPASATLASSILDTDLVTLSKGGAAAQVQASVLKAYLKAA